MMELHIQAFSVYTGAPDRDLRRLKEEVTSLTRVSFRRGNRFILLSLLGACRCLHGAPLDPDMAIYLTTEHGNLGETSAVLDEIYADRSLPKPYGFINTMSGTAAFYLAQTLKARGRSITVSSRDLSFERGLDLLIADFTAGVERNALVGGVDEASPCREDAVQGEGRGLCAADGSGWFYIRPGREGACGAFLTNRSFRDARSCIDWIRSRAGAGPDIVAFGARIAGDEASSLAEALRPMERFDYLPEVGYSGSSTACGIGRFLERFRGRTLLHINRDPRGNCALLEVERY